MYDVIIIGSGPAGISAGIYLKRAKKNILIISKGIGALEKAHKIENYYGVEPISGKGLYNIGLKQVQKLDIPMVTDEVTSILYDGKFIITTANRTYESSQVILATGTNRNAPNIKGIKEFEGKGVSYCAICDAFFFRGKDVAVIGNGNYAIHEAKQLKSVAKSVTILTNGSHMIQNRDASDFEVNEEPIREFRGNNKVEEVEFESQNIKKIDGVFVAIGTASSVDLARKSGAVIHNNNIIVDNNMETNVKGLYACGDCTGGLLQINKAVYEGAVAALNIIQNMG